MGAEFLKVDFVEAGEGAPRAFIGVRNATGVAVGHDARVCVSQAPVGTRRKCLPSGTRRLVRWSAERGPNRARGTRKRAARPKPRRAGLAIPEARLRGRTAQPTQQCKDIDIVVTTALIPGRERRAIERTDASRLRAALPPLTLAPPHPPPPRDAPRRFRAPELITKEMVDGGERVSKSRRASAGIPIPQPPPPATAQLQRKRARCASTSRRRRAETLQPPPRTKRW